MGAQNHWHTSRPLQRPPSELLLCVDRGPLDVPVWCFVCCVCELTLSCCPQAAKQQAGGSDGITGGSAKAADGDPPKSPKSPKSPPDGIIVNPPMLVRTSVAYQSPITEASRSTFVKRGLWPVCVLGWCLACDVWACSLWFAPPQATKQQTGGSDGSTVTRTQLTDDDPDGYIVNPPMLVRPSPAYYEPQLDFCPDLLARFTYISLCSVWAWWCFMARRRSKSW
jgi:hypothetical protein